MLLTLNTASRVSSLKNLSIHYMTKFEDNSDSTNKIVGRSNATCHPTPRNRLARYKVYIFFFTSIEIQKMKLVHVTWPWFKHFLRNEFFLPKKKN